ncbi:MAG: flippase [Bacteroidota bacterium]
MNFSTNVIVLLVAFFCLPFIVSVLGTESFGLLSILWLFVGYSATLDAGIGQASVKFVAGSIGSSGSRAASILQASVLLSLGVGILAGIGLFALSFADVYSLLNISGGLKDLAQSGIRVMALIPPAVLLQGALKSVPLAMNRFELANTALILNGVVQWGGSVVVLLFGGGLLEIVWLTVLARYAGAVVLLIIAVILLPEVKKLDGSAVVKEIPKILAFGGWVSVSQIAAPLLSFLERFFIGGLLSLSFVTFFSVPNDLIIRFLAIPMSLVTTLVPSMSGAWNDPARRQSMWFLYQRSIKFVYLLVVPMTAMIIVLSEDFLTLWLDQEFAAQSALVLQILSVGLVFNALAQFPVAALQAVGRPEIPSRVVLAELVLYALLCYYATLMFGIVGTAVVWAIRVFVEAMVLLWFVQKEMKNVLVDFGHSYVWKSLGCLLPGSFVLWLAVRGTGDLLTLVVGSIAFILLYGAGVWMFGVDASERRIVGERFTVWQRGKPQP